MSVMAWNWTSSSNNFKQQQSERLGSVHGSPIFYGAEGPPFTRRLLV